MASWHMMGKVAWFAGCALLCVLAVGFQFDRSARKDARVAAWTPEIFKGYALETQARDALANGAAEQGLAAAHELVRRRPIPAESLALYTNALLATGQGDAAPPPLMLAAQRGWRDRYVQRLMVLVGLQSGDWQSAAQRLIALWRQGICSHQEPTHARSRGHHDCLGIHMTHDPTVVKFVTVGSGSRPDVEFGA